jgi:hypothetical protein
MQLHQPITLERFESVADVAGNEVAAQPASTHSWDFVTPNRDEVVALLTPGGDRRRTVILVAGALVAGFGLGWACGPIIAVLHPITQTETPSHRTAELKSGGRIDGVRKPVSTPGLQTPPAVSAVSVTGANPPAKPSGGTRLSVESASASTTPVTPANTTITAREPVVAAPETRPTTIEGWTVLDVRGGTVVLEGPDGVRTAARGDTVPGIGRIVSIVRWGNRWIVATASGLIATP